MYKHHSNQLPPIFNVLYLCFNTPSSKRNVQDYSINKTKKMFSYCAIRNCGPSFWNSVDKTMKNCKTTQHFRNQCLMYCGVLLSVSIFLSVFLQVFVYLLQPKGHDCLRPFWPSDHVLNIMLCFIGCFDIGKKF